MDFNTDNKAEMDTVSFYIRNDFNEIFKDIVDDFLPEQENLSVSHSIRRDDIFSRRYYIKKYMDTSVEIKRPDTPKKLIINQFPKDFIPKY